MIIQQLTTATAEDASLVAPLRACLLLFEGVGTVPDHMFGHAFATMQ
jgi:hypothetical protein